MQEAPAQDYSKHISSSIYTVIGHLQQEGSDQGLCGCSCCTIHLRYRHHQVIMLRSEGLEVPLGGSRGLGSASVGLLRARECFWGALGGLWLQNSLSAQNRIIRSNLKNTDIYVINTIRRIIRLRRMTHPCLQCSQAMRSTALLPPLRTSPILWAGQ